MDRLKSVQRKTYNYHEKRHENSGEHSWHLALAVLSFHPLAKSNTLDLFRAVKMALLHDIVEIDAGDQIVYQEDPNKFDREKKAADRIFGLLPKTMADEFVQLWVEFEKKQCPESQFVGALDRFLPLYSNTLNEGYTWKQHNITLDMVYQKNREAIQQGCPELWDYADGLLLDCVKKGYLKTH